MASYACITVLVSFSCVMHVVFANKKKKVSSLLFLYKRRSDRQTDPRFSREIAGGGSGVQFKEHSQGVALASSVGGDAGADLCICNS